MSTISIIRNKKAFPLASLYTYLTVGSIDDVINVKGTAYVFHAASDQGIIIKPYGSKAKASQLTVTHRDGSMFKTVVNRLGRVPYSVLGKENALNVIRCLLFDGVEFISEEDANEVLQTLSKGTMGQALSIKDSLSLYDITVK